MKDFGRWETAEEKHSKMPFYASLPGNSDMGPPQSGWEKVGWEKRGCGLLKGLQRLKVSASLISPVCLSSRGAKCCPCWLLVGSNERRHTKWYFSLSCLEQVPAESFGSCWVLCSGNFCSTECWSHCHSWMTPDPLVTMSLTRRSEGVKTRWNPSCVLLQGRKHLLTSRAAGCSIWGVSCPKWIQETTNSPGRSISWPESQNINCASLSSKAAPLFPCVLFLTATPTFSACHPRTATTVQRH